MRVFLWGAGVLLCVVMASQSIAAQQTTPTPDTTVTPSRETPIMQTPDIQTQAKRWDVSPGEYQRYIDLMRGPLGKWNADIDPLLALGMFAESPEQQRVYAERYARQEFEFTERALAFQRAYHAAFERLYPKAPMLDQRLLAPYFTHQQQKAERQAVMRQARQRFVEGDRLLVFVPLSCSTCLKVINRLANIVHSRKNSGVDIYVRDAVDKGSVSDWATTHGIQTKWLADQRLTLNRDEGLLQRLLSQSSGASNDAIPIFLKRDGRFYQISAVQLGL